MAAFPRSLVLVGAGKMGGSMLAGWLAKGLAADAVTVIEPNPSPELDALVREHMLTLNPPAGATTPPDILVLGIKPQMLDEIGPGLRPLVDATAIVRAMPNLPASIGQGATGVYASPQTSEAQKALATTLLAANGIVEWVGSENLIDAVTGVSGSGPAYVFHLVECLAQAGVAAGLKADVAERLALATITGAASLLATSGLPPATLRQNVTSPAGTTAAALDVLMRQQNGLAALMSEAVSAAKRRAGELAG
jgi:pyrroline-5-carboxylate reductase